MNYSEEHKKIGGWLREKRKASNLTQAQLAGLIGCHKSIIGRYEAGRRMGIVQFIKITAALNAKPEEAFELCVEVDRR
ncbi:MAG: helix-turn-helix transcriptional regulator [bacterium]